MNEEQRTWRTYGAAVVGNYRGAGAPIVRGLRKHPRLMLVSGYEADERRRQELSQVMGVSTVETCQEILDDPLVEIVAIATPPNEKAGWVEEAAKAGKNILLTKPMCDSLDSARKILWVL